MAPKPKNSTLERGQPRRKPGQGCVSKRRRIIPYRSWLVPLARNLRNNSTAAEVQLWQRLKTWQMHGYDFHRQRPVDRYILDFFCVELMLAIEIDGCSHVYRDDPEQDVVRQQRLESLGIYVMRFDDLEVKQNIEEVMDSISAWIEVFEENKR